MNICSIKCLIFTKNKNIKIKQKKKIEKLTLILAVLIVV